MYCLYLIPSEAGCSEKMLVMFAALILELIADISEPWSKNRFCALYTCTHPHLSGRGAEARQVHLLPIPPCVREAGLGEFDEVLHHPCLVDDDRDPADHDEDEEPGHNPPGRPKVDQSQSF